MYKNEPKKMDSYEVKNERIKKKTVWCMGMV